MRSVRIGSRSPARTGKGSDRASQRRGRLYLKLAAVRVTLATMTASGGEVTGLLRSWRAGDAAAGEQLLPIVYAELHRLAESHLRKERANHTLRPTELIAEAYLRLAAGAQPEWDCRVQFFA